MNNFLKKLSLLILVSASCAYTAEPPKKNYRASTTQRIIYTGCGGLLTAVAINQFDCACFRGDLYPIHFGLGVGFASLAGVYFAKAYQGKPFSASYKSLVPVIKYFPGVFATTAGSFILAQATQRAMTERSIPSLVNSCGYVSWALIGGAVTVWGAQNIYYKLEKKH